MFSLFLTISYFFDQEKIYPCYVPVELRPDSKHLLPENQFMRILKTRFRTMYEPVNEISEGAPPELFLLPCFSEQSFIEEIDKNECCNIVLNANLLTGEINRYATIFNLIKSRSNMEQEKRESLEILLKDIKCYRIGIKKGEDIVQIGEKVMTLIN